MYVRWMYMKFPLVERGLFQVVSVRPLHVNPHDPGTPASDLPGVRLTYDYLRGIIDSQPGGHAESPGIEIAPGVTIHDHPGTDRALQVHFMVDGQKVAEIGPQHGPKAESVVPGYIAFLAEWENRPVRHRQWKRRLEADNGL